MLQPVDLLFFLQSGCQWVFLRFFAPLEEIGGVLGGGAIPDFGLGFTEAAQMPIRADSGIDECDLFGTLRLEAVVSLGIFAGDDLRLCIDASFEGIAADSGFPFGGSRFGR